MEEGEELLLPGLMWGLPCLIGRRETTSALRTLNVSKKIPCAVGVLNPKACAITGEDGKDPPHKILTPRALRKKPFKVSNAADPLFPKVLSTFSALFSVFYYYLF